MSGPWGSGSGRCASAHLLALQGCCFLLWFHQWLSKCPYSILSRTASLHCCPACWPLHAGLRQRAPSVPDLCRVPAPPSLFLPPYPACRASQMLWRGCIWLSELLPRGCLSLLWAFCMDQTVPKVPPGSGETEVLWKCHHSSMGKLSCLVSVPKCQTRKECLLSEWAGGSPGEACRELPDRFRTDSSFWMSESSPRHSPVCPDLSSQLCSQVSWRTERDVVSLPGWAGFLCGPLLFLVVGWWGRCCSWQHCGPLWVCVHACVRMCTCSSVCVHKVCVWYMHVSVCGNCDVCECFILLGH